MKAKKAVTKSVQELTLDHWNETVEELTMQGQFAQLLIDEKANVTWQSVIRNVPKGILSFALRSVTNTLPSPDNLVRWGKRSISRVLLFFTQFTLHPVHISPSYISPSADFTQLHITQCALHPVLLFTQSIFHPVHFSPSAYFPSFSPSFKNNTVYSRK